jgi:hypothetical protein
MGPAPADTLYVEATAMDEIWCLRADGRPARYEGSIQEFVADPGVRSAGRIRMTGRRLNARLIGQLGLRVGARLELCSPMIGKGLGASPGPGGMLDCLRREPAGVPASLGGFHRLSESELLIYRAASCSDSKEVVALLANHPAWGPINFVPGLDPSALARLLVVILDPRWHVDRERPGCECRLMSYLGLADAARSSWARAHAEAVRRTWCTSPAPTADVLRGPEGFVWRSWAARRGTPELAVLAGSRRFVRLLRDVWLGLLDVSRRPAGGNLYYEPIFDPEAFFGPEERESGHAFKLYCDGLS